MTTEQFIASLPPTKSEALGEIEGFTAARDRWGPPLTSEEREALARVKAQIKAGRRS